MSLVEAYDGRTTEQRWDWVLSRLQVVDIGKDEARQARRLLAGAKLHGHKNAIDAVLAVIARQQEGRCDLTRAAQGRAGNRQVDAPVTMPRSVSVQKAVPQVRAWRMQRYLVHAMRDRNASWLRSRDMGSVRWTVCSRDACDTASLASPK
jgi:hypothetical protein